MNHEDVALEIARTLRELEEKVSRRMSSLNKGEDFAPENTPQTTSGPSGSGQGNTLQVLRP